MYHLIMLIEHVSHHGEPYVVGEGSHNYWNQNSSGDVIPSWVVSFSADAKTMPGTTAYQINAGEEEAGKSYADED